MHSTSFPIDAMRRVLEFESVGGPWSGFSFAFSSWSLHNLFRWAVSNTKAGKYAVLSAVAQSKRLPTWLLERLEKDRVFRGVWQEMDPIDCPSLIALDIPNTLWGIGTDLLSYIAEYECMRSASCIIWACENRKEYDVLYQLFYHALSHEAYAIADDIRAQHESSHDSFLLCDELNAIEEMHNGNLNLIDNVELCTEVALSVLPYYDHPDLVRFLVNVAFVNPNEIVSTVSFAQHRKCAHDLMCRYDNIGPHSCLLQLVDEMPTRMPTDVLAAVWSASQNSNRGITNAVLEWARIEARKECSLLSGVTLKSILIIAHNAADTDQWNVLFQEADLETKSFVRETMMNV